MQRRGGDRCNTQGRPRALHQPLRALGFWSAACSAREVIDATRKGGPARFVNHSCAPNCATEKWLVGGQLRVGIFARAAIPAGAEVTYDYRFAWNGGKRVRCACFLVIGHKASAERHEGSAWSRLHACRDSRDDCTAAEPCLGCSFLGIRKSSMCR
jgi:hypothetical protein